MARTFTPEDQQKFAELSGDYNPIHVDAIAARRFMFGRPVVHGIHTVLWALDAFLSMREQAGLIRAVPVRIQSLKVNFNGPVIVGEPVELEIAPAKGDKFRMNVSVDGVRRATIHLILASSALGRSAPVTDELPDKCACRELTSADVLTAAGTLPLCFPVSGASLFPCAARVLAIDQLALLLATTRLVGMNLPGLHSLYTGLELTATSAETPADDAAAAVLAYRAESFDERFSMLTVRVDGAGMSGTVSAALRPPPRRQASFAHLRTLVGREEFGGVRALVIGGSRGLGEVAVKALAAGGADVRFTYHRGAADAQSVAAEVTAGGGRAGCFAYDVVGESGSLRQHLGTWSPTLLCYFATPFIFSATAGAFSAELFRTFCDVYVLGFLRAFEAVADGAMEVINPSSSALDELPPNMREYAAAKAAAEMLCQSLAKSRPDDVFVCPRLPRLPTDQTASLLDVNVGDPVTVTLEILRGVRTRVKA